MSCHHDSYNQSPFHVGLGRGLGWTERKCNRSGVVFCSAWDVQRFGTARKYNMGRRKGLCRYSPYGKWESGATSFLDAPCQAIALYCIVVSCSLG